MFENFVKGLKKSFSGQEYLRELSNCEICGNKSYLEKICLYCSTKEAYRQSEERN